MSAPADARECVVQAGALRLHCVEWNAGGGRPVLLLHGAAAELHSWEPVAERLAARCHVVAVDLRGHGDSDRAADGYRVGGFVDDAVHLLDALGLERVDAVGHSLGARIAIGLAGSRPQRVRRLVLSEGAPELPREAVPVARDILVPRDMPRGFATADDALDYVQRAHPQWRPRFHDLWVAHALRRNWAGKLVAKADPELSWLAGSAGAADTPWLWQMCARITAPALLIRGAQSPFLDAALVQRMRDAMPALSVRELPCGHFAPRELPDEFSDAVAAFLDA